MTEELRTSSSLLNAAITRYASACSALATSRDLSNASQGTLDVLLDESELLKSHRLRILRAEMSLARARNNIHSLVPIHRLSSEILAVIFRFTVVVDRSSLHSAEPKTDARKAFSVSQPETITHVCSRWRWIGLDLTWLWSRFAVPFSKSTVDCGLLTRAKIFAERARQLPLDIYLFDATNYTVLSVDGNLTQFCAATASRIRSLCLSPSDRFGSHCIEVLRSIFANGAPGTLVEFSVQGSAVRKAGTSNAMPDLLNIELPKDIEGRLAAIEILKLTGVFFRWNSQAYQNLAELRLLPSNQDSGLRLTGSTLRNILVTSPKLRIFQLGLEMVDTGEGSSSHEVVRLRKLEESSLGKIGLPGYHILFRLLSPGSNPLDLSLVIPPPGIQGLKEGFKAFLTRSKVRRLDLRFATARSYNKQIQLEQLFSRLPHLEALAVTGDDIGLDEWDPHKQAYSQLPNGPQLKILVLMNCRIDLGYLQRMAGIVPIRSIKLAYCFARSASASERSHFFQAAGFYHEIGDIIPLYRFFTLPGAARHYSEKAADAWSPWL